MTVHNKIKRRICTANLADEIRLGFSHLGDTHHDIAVDKSDEAIVNLSCETAAEAESNKVQISMNILLKL